MEIKPTECSLGNSSAKNCPCSKLDVTSFKLASEIHGMLRLPPEIPSVWTCDNTTLWTAAVREMFRDSIADDVFSNTPLDKIARVVLEDQSLSAREEFARRSK